MDVITSHIPGAEEQPHVIRLGRSQPVYANGSQARVTLGWNLRRDMRRVLREGRYDIVHVHSPLTPDPSAPRDRGGGLSGRSARSTRTSIDRSATRSAASFFQKRLDMLSAAVAVSNSTTVALNRYFEADWQIIPNGIDTDVFHPSAPPPPGITNDVPTILFLGRFDPRNGLTTLIDSFRRVKAKGNRGRQARLVVVGDGPLREHYYKQANGDKDIVFVGAVLEGRPSYYAHSSVYACPTTKASFGITLLESMACETPVVCSDILGFRDVVVDGREALMVPCGDRDALADALVRVLDDAGSGDSARHHRAAEFARILVGACHVSRTGRVSNGSRKRRRRGMILGLGAGAVVLGGAAHGAFHRNSPIFGRPITRLARRTSVRSR